MGNSRTNSYIQESFIPLIFLLRSGAGTILNTATNILIAQLQHHTLQHTYQKMRQDLIRKLAVSIIFIFTNIIIWHKKDKKNAQNQNQNDGWLSDLIDIRLAGQFTSLLADEELTSGVGLVTTDGMWGELTEVMKSTTSIKMRI